MSLNLTSNEILDIFDSYSRKYHKINVPSLLDDKLARNIIIFFDDYNFSIDDLENFFVKFFEDRIGYTVELKDFVMKLNDYAIKKKIAQEDKEHIDRLMLETRERMQRANEL